MTTTIEIFRKLNFLLLDKILNNGDNTIEASSFINPKDEIFETSIPFFLPAQ